MGPYEIMKEHIDYWTSDECEGLLREDMQLIQRLGEVVGVNLSVGERLEKAEDYR